MSGNPIPRPDECVCDHNPETTDGPQEDCPEHGRPYSHWVEATVAKQQQIDELRAEVKNLRDYRTELLDVGFGYDDSEESCAEVLEYAPMWKAMEFGQAESVAYRYRAAWLSATYRARRFKDGWDGGIEAIRAAEAQVAVAGSLACGYCCESAASCSKAPVKCCPDCTGSTHQWAARALRAEAEVARLRDEAVERQKLVREWQKLNADTLAELARQRPVIDAALAIRDGFDRGHTLGEYSTFCDALDAYRDGGGTDAR